MNGLVVVCKRPSDESVELRRFITFADFCMSLLENDCSGIDDMWQKEMNIGHCDSWRDTVFVGNISHSEKYDRQGI